MHVFFGALNQRDQIGDLKETNSNDGFDLEQQFAGLGGEEIVIG